jgi:hypothetical protein
VDFPVKAFEIGQVRGFSGQQTEVRTLGGKRSRDVVAYKSRCAG